MKSSATPVVAILFVVVAKRGYRKITANTCIPHSEPLFNIQSTLSFPSSSSFSVQGSVFRRIDALLGEFRVGGGVHDSYTFQCGLVGSFTSPGIDTR